MKPKSTFFLFLIALFVSAVTPQKLVFFCGRNSYCTDIDSIDSICFSTGNKNDVWLFTKQGNVHFFHNLDSAVFDNATSDTLELRFDGSKVSIHNPHVDLIDVQVSDSNADVKVRKAKLPDFVIKVTGQSDDGRICIDADTAYSVVLSDLCLSSSHAPALNSMSKQKVRIVLDDNTANYLSDAAYYTFDDSLEKANACVCSQGNITIEGGGELTVSAHSKHALASGKGMRMESGNISVVSAPSDAVHSDKYFVMEGGSLHLDGQLQDGIDASEYVEMNAGSIYVHVMGEGEKAVKCTSFAMNGGELSMLLSANASKGIKTKQNIEINNGVIKAVANGSLINNDGDLSYCSILKSDGDTQIYNGTIDLQNNGKGGKCITADGCVYITGGDINLCTNGDGASFINKNGEEDYYTAKCLAVDANLSIYKGNITCTSTGQGGKGIVVSGKCNIGKYPEEGALDSIRLVVETQGAALVNDTVRDERFGCPKAIKVEQELNMYGGDVLCVTHGMGGEGIECAGAMFVYGGNITCNTFDDGINVGRKFDMKGGVVDVFSSNNDGIDSNGKMAIMGGFICAQSAHVLDEAIDTEHGQFFIKGGSVFGLGPSTVNIATQGQPYFTNEPTGRTEDLVWLSEFSLCAGKYYYVVDEDSVVMAMRCERDVENGFFCISHSSFVEGKEYLIYEGESPDCHNERYYIGNISLPQGSLLVTKARVTTKDNYY